MTLLIFYTLYTYSINYNSHTSVRRMMKILLPNTSIRIVSSSDDDLVYKTTELEKSDDSVFGSLHLKCHPCSVSQIYVNIYVCRSTYCEMSSCITSHNIVSPICVLTNCLVCVLFYVLMLQLQRLFLGVLSCVVWFLFHRHSADLQYFIQVNV